MIASTRALNGDRQRGGRQRPLYKTIRFVLLSDIRVRYSAYPDLLLLYLAIIKEPSASMNPRGNRAKGCSRCSRIPARSSPQRVSRSSGAGHGRSDLLCVCETPPGTPPPL